MKTRLLPTKRKRKTPWPPLELCLPNLDTLERLSQGIEEPVQQRLFDEPSDIPYDLSREKMRNGGTRFSKLFALTIIPP
jgi:hypothetical protein